MPLRSGTLDDAEVDPERIERICRRAPLLIDDDTQCMVLVAARHGIVFVEGAWGPRAPEPHAPEVALDTIFPLGSLTKPITATCAMILVEDGLLQLMRPVQDYVPEFRGDGKGQVLVHHLLTHTSGISDVTSAPDAWGQRPLEPRLDTAAVPRDQHPDVERQLRGIFRAPLARPPGRRHDYSNAGFTLVGEIVRRIAGTSLDVFARERLFAPLGMTDSHYVLPHEKFARVVQRPATAPFVAGSPHGGFNGRRDAETPWAYGGVYGTAWDVARFAQMFLDALQGNARVLSLAGARAMTSNQTKGIPGAFEIPAMPTIELAEVAIGYPWVVGDHPRYPYLDNSLVLSTRFGHMGGGGAMIYCEPSLDMAIVTLSAIRRTREDGFARYAGFPLADMALASAR